MARQLLRSTGSPQQDAAGRPASQRIGNRRDLRQLIAIVLSIHTTALYRYSKGGGDSDHFYTTNWNELGNGALGYTFEGIQCYVCTSPLTLTTIRSTRDYNAQILTLNRQNLSTGPRQSGSVSDQQLDNLTRSKRLARISITIDVSTELD